MMSSSGASYLHQLLAHIIGQDRAREALATLDIDDAIMAGSAQGISRAMFAMALNVLLFCDLLDRVPSAASYVAEQRRRGARIRFDHGALRTIRFAEGPTGALPGGIAAIARLLEPMGYAEAGLYPLPALKMTGHAFAHRDHAETIPQFFVSELHVDQFDQEFQAAAHRVFDSSSDPLDEGASEALAMLARDKEFDPDLAKDTLPAIIRCFARQHGPVRLEDYQTLLSRSAEAAWIATEGQAFNHATDRVDDVEALAAILRKGGKPIKDTVEVSASGRVRQTAFRADPVVREFLEGDGSMVSQSVPGSFYEFISRDIDPATGRLDLRFDSANATGIFAMTRRP